MKRLLLGLMLGLTLLASAACSRKDFELTGGTLLADERALKAAYARFDGTYRHALDLPAGKTVFAVRSGGAGENLRYHLEDASGQNIGRLLPQRQSVVELPAAGKCYLVVSGSDQNGSFEVFWFKQAD